MKKIRVPMHSFVDVITNSSTVIYISPHSKSIELAKELINTILRISQSDKTADDLFTFGLEPGDEDAAIDYLMEEISSNIEREFPKEFKAMYDSVKGATDLFTDVEIVDKVCEKLEAELDAEDLIEAKAKEKLEEIKSGNQGLIQFCQDHDLNLNGAELVITAKDDSKEAIKLSETLQRIFHIEEGEY